jgi:hypothetical protein
VGLPPLAKNSGISVTIWVSTHSVRCDEADGEGLQAFFLDAGVSQCDVGRRVGIPE